MTNTKQATQDRLTMSGRYVVGVRCGMNHSGNDHLSRTTANFYECAGCASHYSVNQVRAAIGKPGHKDGQLYDARVS